MVYCIGDRVLYGIHGVCQIVEIQMQTINKKLVEYYVLEPVSQVGARFFVPSQNEKAVAKLRPVLTREQADVLMHTANLKSVTWSDDDNEKKKYYSELISSGDRAELLAMIRILRNYKQQQLQAGKKFHVNDANFLKEAEKMLFGELSTVLEIPYEQIESYIAWD